MHTLSIAGRVASSPLAALLALLSSVALAGCAGAPEIPTGDVKYDADYLAANGATYLESGRYGEARDQFERSLKETPGVWIRRLGVASCDHFLGAERIQNADYAGARKRLEMADESLRELWNGNLAADTSDTATQAVQPWKAALILAMNERNLAELARREAVALQARLESGREERRAEEFRTLLDKRKAEHLTRRAAALDLFGRLRNMRNGPPDALLEHAELLAVEERYAEAERDWGRWLKLARDTRESLLLLKERSLESPTMTEAQIEAQVNIADFKLASNREKQLRVLDRLGSIHFERSATARRIATQGALSEAARADATELADNHAQQGAEYLEDALVLAPERDDLLSKLAQLEMELGLLESADDRLGRYLRRAADAGREYREDKAVQAVMKMRAEVQRRLELRAAGVGKSDGRG